jgi:hypothetical protein
VHLVQVPYGGRRDKPRLVRLATRTWAKRDGRSRNGGARRAPAIGETGTVVGHAAEVNYHITCARVRLVFLPEKAC